jgi:hypothetical protein
MNGNDTINTVPRKLQLDEAKICQLIAVLEKMWPDLGPSKPHLKVIQGGKGSAGRFPFLEGDATALTPSPFVLEVDASAIAEVSL